MAGEDTRVASLALPARLRFLLREALLAFAQARTSPAGETAGESRRGRVESILPPAYLPILLAYIHRQLLSPPPKPLLPHTTRPPPLANRARAAGFLSHGRASVVTNVQALRNRASPATSPKHRAESSTTSTAHRRPPAIAQECRIAHAAHLAIIAYECASEELFCPAPSHPTLSQRPAPVRIDARLTPTPRRLVAPLSHTSFCWRIPIAKAWEQ